MHHVRTLFLLITLAALTAACGDNPVENNKTTVNTNTGNANNGGGASAIVADDITVLDTMPREITLTSVTLASRGFIVIREDAGGGPGTIIGVQPYDGGTQTDVPVTLDRDVVDGETLYASLHLDVPADGVFTYPMNNDEDFPAVDGNGDPISASFVVSIEQTIFDPSITVTDQEVEPLDRVLVQRVSANVRSMLVIQTGNSSDTAIGNTFVEAGITESVEVELEMEVDPGTTLTAALYDDGNMNGMFDGSTIDPIAVDMAGMEVRRQFDMNLPPPPTLTVSDQTADPADTVVVDEVDANRDGFVVIFETDFISDEIDLMAPLGMAPVTSGLNEDVTVELDRAVEDGELLGAVLFIDTDGNGMFDETDGIASDRDPEMPSPVAGTFTATPGTSEAFLQMGDQLVTPGSLRSFNVDSVIVGSDAFVVIREDDGGSAGASVGTASVSSGVSVDTALTLDRDVEGPLERFFAELWIDDGDGSFDINSDTLATRDGTELSVGFRAVIFENTVVVNDQSLDSFNTVITVQAYLAKSAGHLVVHEGASTGIGTILGTLAVPEGVSQMPTDITLNRPVADGETLFVDLFVEAGGSPDFSQIDDTPAVDDVGSPVSASFVATVPADTPSVQLNLVNDGSSAWRVESVEPSAYYDAVVGGDAQTDNPTLTLEQGWRYAFSLGMVALSHPIEFGIRGGGNSNTDWPLGMGPFGEENILEVDPDVNWFDDGRTVAFTVTPTVVNRVEDYRCQIHRMSMLGGITYAGQ